MRIDDVDERSRAEWEIQSPVFRVYFWTHDRTNVSCSDVRGADFATVSAWASTEAQKRGAEIDIAVQAVDGSAPGLIWLIGDGASGRRS